MELSVRVDVSVGVLLLDTVYTLDCVLDGDRVSVGVTSADLLAVVLSEIEVIE